MERALIKEKGRNSHRRTSSSPRGKRRDTIGVSKGGAVKLRTSFKRDAVPNDLTHLARALTAIGAHGTADDFGQAAGDTYEPFRLMDRKIILSDETLGAIS